MPSLMSSSRLFLRTISCSLNCMIFNFRAKIKENHGRTEKTSGYPRDARSAGNAAPLKFLADQRQFATALPVNRSILFRASEKIGHHGPHGPVRNILGDVVAHARQIERDVVAHAV